MRAYPSNHRLHFKTVHFNGPVRPHQSTAAKTRDPQSHLPIAIDHAVPDHRTVQNILSENDPTAENNPSRPFRRPSYLREGERGWANLGEAEGASLAPIVAVGCSSERSIDPSRWFVPPADGLRRRLWPGAAAATTDAPCLKVVELSAVYQIWGRFFFFCCHVDQIVLFWEDFVVFFGLWLLEFGWFLVWFVDVCWFLVWFWCLACKMSEKMCAFDAFYSLFFLF